MQRESLAEFVKGILKIDKGKSVYDIIFSRISCMMDRGIANYGLSFV